MSRSPNRYLRLAMAILVALTVCAFAIAQNTPSATPPAANGNQAPPTAQAAPNTQEPANQAAPSQNLPAASQDQPTAQEASGQDQGRFVFKKQVQEVVLHATVVDEQGRLVTSLDKTAFTVFQNGVPEQITSFRREDVPVALGIVIDNSGSMRDKRAKVNEAVLDLIRASNPQDEVFVVNFSQKPYLDQDFTSDVGLLRAALRQTSNRGSTALYDAVVASAVHLRNNPRLDKKVLLVITDGEDNMSRESLQEAMRQLQPSKGPAVYAIGLTNEGFTRSGREALQSLATTTGGVAFFPDSLSDVDAITGTVARDIRSQYTLTYNPKNIKSGYQSIRVEAKVPGHGQLTVRTRTGYYPGEAMH